MTFLYKISYMKHYFLIIGHTILRKPIIFGYRRRYDVDSWVWFSAKSAENS